MCCWLSLVSNCSAFSYTPVNNDPSIEYLVQTLFTEGNNIAQSAEDRANDRLLTLLDSVRHLIRTELGQTHVGILNNRANAQAREYCNDVWIIIDSATKALDVQINISLRRIEQKLGNDSVSIAPVEAALKELTAIAWSWQNDAGRLLYDANERRQKLFDGLSFEALDRLHQSGWRGVEKLLADREHTILQVIYAVRDKLILSLRKKESRIHELTQVFLNAGLHESSNRTI